MKWSTLTLGLMMLGLIGISGILLFQKITTNNENDYYLLKEVTEASMIESVDIPFYRTTGDLKIVKEKFVENFTRRYAESISFLNKNYSIKFYDIIENPPKVSVIVDNDIGNHNVYNTSFDYKIKNRLDAILEYTRKEKNDTTKNNEYLHKKIEKIYYAFLPVTPNTLSENSLSIKIPDELNVFNIKNIKIDNVKLLDSKLNANNLYRAILEMKSFYNNTSNIDFIQEYNDVSTNNSIDLSYYNCGINGVSSNCNDKDKYFIKVKSFSNNKIALFKYKVDWSYDEFIF